MKTNPFLVATAVVGVAAGALFATYQHDAKVYTENASRIVEMGELAKPFNPALIHILRKNSVAPLVVETVKTELKKYQCDPAYQTGVAQMISAEHLVAQIFIESGGNPKTKGAIDEIGLMQVRPLHVKDLCGAGILPRADEKLLWNPTTNVRSGVFILMNIARKSKTVTEAFAVYNAGLGKKRFGFQYARKVEILAEKLRGGETI